MKNSEEINMYKKNLVMFAAVVMMAASVSACENGKQEVKETSAIETMKASQAASENTQIANPWTEVKTMEEAKDMVGFDLKLPEIPAEYGKKMIQVLDSADAPTIEVIFWNNEDKEIRIRKAPGTGDISGDYTAYAQEQKVQTENRELTLKGEEDKVFLATWTEDGYTYSMYVEAGISADEMTGMAGRSAENGYRG